MTDFELFTASYKTFHPSMGLPVQTSNGRPKYPLRYALQYRAPLVYPERRLMKLSAGTGFRAQYQQMLDRHGLGNLQDLFSRIAEHSGESKLVLLCFEKDVRQCHRGDFADWWARKTGELVKELS